MNNSRRMRTYPERAANPFRMRTYKIIGLKVAWNEQLQKKTPGEGCLFTTDTKRSGEARCLAELSL